jgi:hypothetical protein
MISGGRGELLQKKDYKLFASINLPSINLEESESKSICETIFIPGRPGIFLKVIISI